MRTATTPRTLVGGLHQRRHVGKLTDKQREKIEQAWNNDAEYANANQSPEAIAERKLYAAQEAWRAIQYAYGGAISWPYGEVA